MFYPLTFEANYKDYVWGGRRLADFGKTLPEKGNVAESWELSTHPNGPSIIANGQFKGKSFHDLIAEHGDQLLGHGLSERDLDKFPLLIKLIDAKGDLSIQVHPDDSYAQVHENGEYGKNEMWIVLDAPEDAKLIAGVKPEVTREDFAQAIADDRVLDMLEHIPVKRGDFVNIPAGVVHAITAGLIIYEVQQNSDTTYRVYDYNRPGNDGKPRELHVDKALDVIRFGSKLPSRYPGLRLSQGNNTQPHRKERKLLVANKYFAVEVQDIAKQAIDRTDGSRFYAYTVVDGKGSLEYKDEHAAHQSLDLEVGRTVFIPAKLGEHEWKNTGGEYTPLKLICSYIPNWAELLTEVEEIGMDPAELSQHIGVEPLAPQLAELLES